MDNILAFIYLVFLLCSVLLGWRAVKRIIANKTARYECKSRRAASMPASPPVADQPACHSFAVEYGGEDDGDERAALLGRGRDDRHKRE
jgi:hypothetical protein